jgi:hypothetical protein
MIHIQAVSRDGQNLQSKLKSLIREGSIKSFEVAQVKGGLKIKHKKYQGSVSLEHRSGLLLATLSCKQKGKEWQLLEAFVGRLSYHCRAEIGSINIQIVPEN